MRVRDRKLFLRWALINVLFVASLVTADISYSGSIPTPAKLAIGAVFSVFAVASAYAGKLAWDEQKDEKHHLSEAIGLCPMVAMLGTVAGFLMALSSDSSDVTNFQQKVAGASSGLLATFVGISCAVVLVLLQLPLKDHATPRQR
jgi:hypothetical protein